jgi:hypothetical protein
VLWVAGLAWGPRDLVAASAEKAVLRTIAAQNAIFVLVNIFYHPFSAPPLSLSHSNVRLYFDDCGLT